MGNLLRVCMYSAHDLHVNDDCTLMVLLVYSYMYINYL